MPIAPQSLDTFWMPFTANREFKAKPRLLAGAQGMYYYTQTGEKILDATAGLWCVNAGHGRREISQAVYQQMEKLDYAPSFLQLSHPLAFTTADQVAQLTPPDLNRIFFTNSGSEAIDTALKIALAYHRCRGESHRVRFIGRERSYHGVNFGGMSVGGIRNNLQAFASNLLPGVSHLRHTYNHERQSFSRGQPEWGEALADDLERFVQLYGGQNIAAVIVEPIAGSTGVLVPPRGYLQRLANIAKAHGILLIFDEVISGFGRLGTPFAAQYFDLCPDLLAMGKGMSNATVPMGAVAAKQEIYETIVATAPSHTPEFFHGYTYSAHPAACAAALATLNIYRQEDLFSRAAEIAPYFQEALHSLRGHSIVRDIRNIGLLGAIEFEPDHGNPGRRALDIHYRCFANGVLVRHTGESITLSPPLIVSRDEIDMIVETLDTVLRSFI